MSAWDTGYPADVDEPVFVDGLGADVDSGPVVVAVAVGDVGCTEVVPEDETDELRRVPLMSRRHRNWHAFVVLLGKCEAISFHPSLSCSLRCRSTTSSLGSQLDGVFRRSDPCDEDDEEPAVVPEEDADAAEGGVVAADEDPVAVCWRVDPEVEVGEGESKYGEYDMTLVWHKNRLHAQPR